MVLQKRPLPPIKRSYSRQQPLTAVSTHEHNFSQSQADWEASVFDRAEYFVTLQFRPRREYRKWTVFPWAVRYAKVNPVALYAVTASGRFTNLDKEKWDEWEARWRRDREPRA